MRIAVIIAWHSLRSQGGSEGRTVAFRPDYPLPSEVGSMNLEIPREEPVNTQEPIARRVMLM
jgi:hypothetical protein